MFILPNYPHTTKWLTEEERAFAAWRLTKDIDEEDTYGEKSMWDGVKMAVRDYRLYLFVLLQHVSLVTQTFQYFFPTIVGTLGYGKIETLWLTAPAWVSDCQMLLWLYTWLLISRTVCDIPSVGWCDDEFSQDKRSIAAYYLSYAFGCCRKCHRSWNNSCRSPILCHVLDADGRCFFL